MYGLERSPDKSLMVVCQGEVLVAAMHNSTATNDVTVVVDVAPAAAARETKLNNNNHGYALWSNNPSYIA